MSGEENFNAVVGGASTASNLSVINGAEEAPSYQSIARMSTIQSLMSSQGLPSEIAASLYSMTTQTSHMKQPKNLALDSSQDTIQSKSLDSVMPRNESSQNMSLAESDISVVRVPTTSDVQESSFTSIKSDRRSSSFSSIGSARWAGSSQASIRSSRRYSTFSSGGRRSKHSHDYKRQSNQDPSEALRKFLDSLKDKQLVSTVEELKKNTKILELENVVFFNFLKANEPSLLEGMEVSLKATQDRMSVSSRRVTLSKLSRRDSSFLGASSSVLTTPIVEKEGPRINITQKTDLILREMDHIQGSLEKLLKKCNTTKHKLKSELEEMTMRESDLQETLTTFEDVFINGTSDKFAQQNPADKFARFMDEAFKRTRLTIDKVRLRTSSLKVQYHKLCTQLTQKKLLGENLHEIDFEQLQIENKRLMEKIDQRNLLLIELKRMNGGANLLLSRHKKVLLKKIEDLKDIQESIQFKEGLIVKLDDECEKVSKELEETKREYDKIKMRTENYEVPPVLDYVKKKAELSLLKKNLKIWARRKQIKDLALSASVREMKHTTGLSAPKPSWFIHPRLLHSGRASVESTFQFVFERERNLLNIPKRKKKNLKPV